MSTFFPVQAQALHQFHAFAAFSTTDDLRMQLNNSDDGSDGSSCFVRMARLFRVVFQIVACDIFVSLRFIYLACVVQTTAMIIR